MLLRLLNRSSSVGVNVALPSDTPPMTSISLMDHLPTMRPDRRGTDPGVDTEGEEDEEGKPGSSSRAKLVRIRQQQLERMISSGLTTVSAPVSRRMSLKRPPLDLSRGLPLHRKNVGNVGNPFLSTKAQASYSTTSQHQRRISPVPGSADAQEVLSGSASEQTGSGRKAEQPKENQTLDAAPGTVQTHHQDPDTVRRLSVLLESRSSGKVGEYTISFKHRVQRDR